MSNTAQDNFTRAAHAKPETPTAAPQADASAAPLTVSWDDLNTRKVEARLKEQDALTRNREYARMDESSLPQGTPTQTSAIARIWRNSIFAMSLFGLLGGLVAWVCGASIQFKATLAQDADARIAAISNIDQQKDNGAIPADQAKVAIDELTASGKQQNPYFAVKTDPKYAEPVMQLQDPKFSKVPLPPEVELQKRDLENQQRMLEGEQNKLLDEINNQDKFKAFLLNVLRYGMSGVMIGMFLAIALPVTEKNLAAVIVNGSIAATLGLIGGVIVSLFVERLHASVIHALQQYPDATQKFLARMAVWGIMGLFLAAAPGVVLRNWRKFAIGLFGGLLGGLLGGVMYEPVAAWAGDKSRLPDLIALAAIGLFTGMTTGLIENVAKTGWVRVVQGLIAGKQFILYRNPTFLGSGPDCQIYLFKDPKVGRRHAAIHIVPGGFELEDLPLGSPTLINGNPVTRAKLKSGDRIQIGSTGLVFQEKTPAK